SLPIFVDYINLQSDVSVQSIRIGILEEQETKLAMQFKTMLKEIRKMKHRSTKLMSKSHIAPEACLSINGGDDDEEEDHHSPWASLPPDLLLDIIQRVNADETYWPGRRDLVACAAVCRSWRLVVGEVVQTPEKCGLLTFPISLKQPGTREHPIHCFIRRERSSSIYLLYLGLSPCEESKLLLAAKKIRRATCMEFVISLVPDDFSRAGLNYVGKLRSNFIGTKFSVYDNHPPSNVSVRSNKQGHNRILLARSHSMAASISYELNVLRTRGPRRMHCTIHSIPLASIQEGGIAPTPTTFIKPVDVSITSSKEPPLTLKNKVPRWHEQLQCWCLNFKGRVTVASVKNFQLVADMNICTNILAVEEQEEVILQFGKIGKDIFTMDYQYPLSAFQAFAICLSSFDTKPACE
ncbi:hypothetical protein V2J09_007572, partial [Rumex salicifolius]